jgi:type II secretory pathway pseudopilin PulG
VKIWDDVEVVPTSPRLAFSLIEIMVTVGLLSFIVIGLLSMFTQTQRAFRNSMAQVDVMETGRITVDMLARELEQAVPARVAYVTNRFAVTNFFVELCPGFGEPAAARAAGNNFPGAAEHPGPAYQCDPAVFLSDAHEPGLGWNGLPGYSRCRGWTHRHVVSLQPSPTVCGVAR